MVGKTSQVLNTCEVSYRIYKLVKSIRLHKLKVIKAIFITRILTNKTYLLKLTKVLSVKNIMKDYEKR